MVPSFHYASAPHIAFVCASLLLGTVLCTGEAAALTKEQAIENCRQTVGRPIVQACMKAQGGAGNLEACRAQAKPKVHACVLRALNAANGRANVPVAIPSEPKSRDAEEAAAAVKPLFVAPPRTISDITAILDSEKPDAKKIEDLKAEADAKPPGTAARAELAKFYYDRGQSRALLGRLSDSMADAKKAVEVARGVVDTSMMGRYQQFLGLQYSAAGDPKQALAIFQQQLQESNVPGAKGWHFNGNRHVARILIQMGDIAQAEAVLRSSLSLIQEARTSGLPGWRSSYAVVGQSWEADVEQTRAMIFEARGQYREAEVSFRVAEQRRRASIKGVLSRPNAPPQSQLLQAADGAVLGGARMKARQTPGARFSVG